MDHSPEIPLRPSGAARPPILLAGPTAVGKSEIALHLAERLGGEIISVDSMQVYRGLDLGTAKPSREERARVPHHLIDVAGLADSFDAAQFVQRAKLAVAEIQARGKVPILCGGTGLYFRAFREGLGDAPPGDSALRRELEATPLADLLQELAARDPATLESIDRRNARRIIRAVEVIRLTGRPFSAQRASWPAPDSPLPSSSATLLCFRRAAPDLRARINLRVEAMFRRGLVTEVAELLRHGLAENQTALQALGYRQVVEHLRGERPLAETIELVKIRTRQFAKRQLTWFRRERQITWLDLQPDQNLADVAGQLGG